MIYHDINKKESEVLDYFKSAISVDCVIIAHFDGVLHFLCRSCDLPNYLGKWSLLGDILHPQESLDQAANRILKARIGLDSLPFEQVNAYGDPHRHELGRVVTVVYLALLSAQQKAQMQHKISDSKWLSYADLGNMAFDHNNIVDNTLTYLKKELFNSVFWADLLNKEFTLSEFQQLLEQLFDVALDKRNFRKKVLKDHLVIPTGNQQSNVKHRPALLYQVNPKILHKSALENYALSTPLF